MKQLLSAAVVTSLMFVGLAANAESTMLRVYKNANSWLTYDWYGVCNGSSLDQSNYHNKYGFPTTDIDEIQLSHIPDGSLTNVDWKFWDPDAGANRYRTTCDEEGSIMGWYYCGEDGDIRNSDYIWSQCTSPYEEDKWGRLTGILNRNYIYSRTYLVRDSATEFYFCNGC